MSDYYNPKKPPKAVLDRLRERYIVDTENGRVFGPRGREVGSDKHRAGNYVCVGICVNYKTYYLKRSHIVWYAHYGEWPARMLDHKDRNPRNDKISNLEYSTPIRNQLNTDRCSNRDLPTGVTLTKNKSKPYMAQTSDGYLGYFKTPEEAHEAYKRARSL